MKRTKTDSFKLRVNWSYLPFLKESYGFRDIWHDQELGSTQSSYFADIPPRDLVLLRLTPVE